MNCLIKIQCITAFLLVSLCLGDTSPDPIPLDLSNYDIINKRQILRNCVEPELGLHIINQAKGIKVHTDQLSIF